MKRLLLFTLWTVESFAAGPTVQKNVGSIEGTVIDRSTHQPLAEVKVIIVETTMSTVTDLGGKFLIKNVPIGTYRVKALMNDYQPEVKTEIVVSTNRVTMVNFELSPAVLELDEIVVTGARYFDKDAEKPISAQTLTSQEIRALPGSMEDVFWAIQSMPGASSTVGKNANLIVRGGAPGEDRTLLENIEIYNPLHFGSPDAEKGAISIVNPSLIERVDFLAGGFPARYGDKMSSVFEIQLKEGNRTDFNTDINFNMAGFTILLDGPVPGDGAMVFSARRGIFDLITSMVNSETMPAYWDAVGKVTRNLGTNHEVSLIGFYYLDDFFKPKDLEGESELTRKFDHKFDNYGSAIGLNWRYLLSKRGYMLTTAALISNGWKSSRGISSGGGSVPAPEVIGDNIREDEFHLKSELTYTLSDAIEMKGGLFWKTINSDHHTWSNEDTTRTGLIIPAYDVTYNPSLTFKTGSFLQTTLRPVTRLSLNAGLRYDYFDFTEESKLSPRLGLSCDITDNTTFNVAYGHFYQTPSAYQVALDPANIALRSGRSIHYIAGIEHLLNRDTKISVEAYHKDLDNVFVDSETSQALTNAGSGYARGIELYIQKKMSKNLMGSAAYTYSVSKRQDGELLPEYYSEFDRPHSFTLVSGYKLSDNLQIGVKFQYASGKLYTPVVGSVQKDGEWYVVDGAYNSARYPAYHTLDIRVDRRFHFRNWTLSAYLDVWNVYNRENVSSYRYDVDDNGAITRETSGTFPMFPILGISAQF